MQNIDVIYRGEVLRLTRFWGDNRLCLYATKPSQTDMPKMEFVGGHPDEWCIFIDNLTDDEKDQIVDFEGHSIDIKDRAIGQKVLMTNPNKPDSYLNDVARSIQLHLPT